jgi:hypothetical protein
MQPPRSDISSTGTASLLGALSFRHVRCINHNLILNAQPQVGELLEPHEKGAHGKVLLLGTRDAERPGKNTTVSYSLARKLRFTVSVTLSRLGVADDGLGERKIEKVETRYGLRYKSAWGLGHELKPKNVAPPR